MRTSLSAFFTWAAREGYVESNPVAYTNKAIENDRADRVLIDDELADIWRATGDDQYGAIVKLLMYRARRDEVASLRWSEVDLDARPRHYRRLERRIGASTSFHYLISALAILRNPATPHGNGRQ